MTRIYLADPKNMVAAFRAAIADIEASGVEVVRIVHDEIVVAAKPARKMKNGKTHPWCGHQPRGEPTNTEKIIPRRHNPLRGKR